MKNSMRPKPAQLSVIVVATLAIVAVAAAMLLAGGNPAQATSAETVALNDNGGGIHLRPVQQDLPPDPTPEPTPEPTPTPVQPTPDPCMGSNPDPVFNTGHIALFEAYWDAGEETLVNNPCPPTLRHIPPTPPATEETHERRRTNANIGSTIFHVSSDYKGTLVAAGTPTNEEMKKWSLADYPFLDEGADAGDAIWVMPECPEDRELTEGELCFGFSAGLLDQYYWIGDLEYEFEFENEPEGIRPPDRGDVFVFYPHDEAPDSERGRATWKSTNVDRNVLSLPFGDYTHRMWAFTKAGTYRLEVHAKGRPSPALIEQMKRPDRKSRQTSTSAVRVYTIHVGLMADQAIGTADEDGNRTLDVVNADSNDTTLDPGDDVKISIQAHNDEGPDSADNTKVKVTLPEGLTYKNHTITIYDSETRTWVTHTSTYNSATGVWSVGDLAVGKSPLLTITATIAAGTRGTEQVITANIHATEEIGSSEVVELDPFPQNNTATGSVTVRSIPNSPPMALSKCSVDEESARGTSVCTVLAKDPDGDSLQYNLEGTGKDNFDVTSVADGVSITVKGNSYLNHEDPKANSFDLTLQVRDGKDEHSNSITEEVADAIIAVKITVDNISEDLPVTLTGPSAATVGSSIRLSASMINPPRLPFHYIWVGRPRGGEIDWRTETADTSHVDVTHSGAAGAREYAVFVRYYDESGSGYVQRTFDSAWKQVDWNADG